MSKIQPRYARKIWQPLNRKSQILATIAVLAVVAFQLHSRDPHVAQPDSSQQQPVQQLSENRSE